MLLLLLLDLLQCRCCARVLAAKLVQSITPLGQSPMHSMQPNTTVADCHCLFAAVLVTRVALAAKLAHNVTFWSKLHALQAAEPLLLVVTACLLQCW
jgi:hypothetical protein